MGVMLHTFKRPTDARIARSMYVFNKYNRLELGLAKKTRITIDNGWRTVAVDVWGVTRYTTLTTQNNTVLKNW